MQYLLLGLSLGLSAGLSPGPLMTLVITTSLRDGFWHGFRVAIAPFLTDLPIILLAVFVLARLPVWTLAVMGFVGSVYIIYLGWETIRTARDLSLPEPLPAVASPAAAEAAGSTSVGGSGTQLRGSQSLLRGAVVNVLNPHPYVFWGAVGAPTLLVAYDQSPLYAVAFLVGFYTLLVGSKIGVAALVHSQSHLLSTTWYRRVLIFLGLLLIGFGIWLGWESLSQASPWLPWSS